MATGVSWATTQVHYKWEMPAACSITKKDTCGFLVYARQQLQPLRRGTHLIAETVACERVLGLELSPNFIELAKANAGERVTFLQHDITSTPFPSKAVDLLENAPAEISASASSASEIEWQLRQAAWLKGLASCTIRA
ncbi:MAG TPA: class I SAM-dependent methyltransferase, partial [Candidatus Binataceae bacterium]|nr:class I SAM-dependent methyltransferase [Candidatus Binataceae bacterium]